MHQKLFFGLVTDEEYEMTAQAELLLAGVRSHLIRRLLIQIPLRSQAFSAFKKTCTACVRRFGTHDLARLVVKTESCWIFSISHMHGNGILVSEVVLHEPLIIGYDEGAS